jgi:C-terminal processing protease CtpA/Prc
MDAKAEAIASLTKGLREEYVFPDVGDAVAKMLEERNARGEYNAVTSATAFSDLLTTQMSEVAHDKHLRFVYSSEVLPPLPVSKPGEPPAYPDNLPQLRGSNYYFEKVERLSGNVGYLKLNAFVYAEGGGAVAAGAMAFLANSDALIIDLRQNDGGEPSMLALLASYFFNVPVHLNDLAFRIAGTKDYNVKQMWTLPYVPGQRYVDKEVYILTSQRTFSGAEEFTYDLQALKRATVVGETTAGGANPGGPYRVGDHFYAAMPMGHAVNPVTKTNWEGKGVAPDIKVPEKDALSTAQRLALQHLVEKTTDQQALTVLKRALAALDTAR